MYFSSTNSSIVLAFVFAACFATLSANATKSSLTATKSVSQLTSTIEATFPSSETYVLTNPSAAILPAFLAAAAILFLLKFQWLFLNHH